ncbi:MAG: M23 family metallopeptidase [Variibacter sp.]
MHHGKLRGSYRRSEFDQIDLGNEPPLSVDGRNGVLVDKRRVSTRWYSGTILTGLCGAALMGGAVYASLDGEAYFAASPERAETARGVILNGERNPGLRKTDKLALATETHNARQIVRISTTTKVGDREAVRVRPYVRISTNLALSTSELSANIPAFNQARIQSASITENATAAPDEAPNVDDAEVSFAIRDLGPVLVRAKIAGTLSPDDIVAHVKDAAGWSGRPGTSPVLASAQPGQALAYATDGAPDPYAGVETRIVPENITLLPKTAAQTTGGNSWNERTVVAKKGDTTASILRDLGASPADAKAIADVAGNRPIKEGQKLKVLLSPVGQKQQPIRVIVMGEQAAETVVALSDTGRYVSVDAQSAETTQVTEADEDEEETSGAVRLYASLYETALRQGVPRPLIDEIARIYSYDVDFQRRVQPGDSIEILYPGDDEGGAEKNEVLYTALTIGGETKRYYRFQTPDDGTVDYYDETGKSAKKFLVRKPITAGIMRSGYGWRRHPILGYSKMHTGVDWAAPRGTPIYASGTGVIEKAGWEGGYGRYIKMRHAYGYETAYGHMSAFARGIKVGTKVRQGQLIGYVGSTGLSTGAHVHYEILVNGRFVDPNRIKLPRGRSLQGPVFASFEQERDKFDAIMNRAPGRVASSVPVAAAPKSTKRVEAAVFGR